MAVDIIARAMAAKANSGGGNQPDLSNYVQFDDYATSTKAGVVKSYINGFQVSENGNPNAAILSKEQYDTIENQYFISKGTLENIKDDYVESSTPVKNLNTSLKDIIPKNNAEGTDNTITDALDKQLFALSGDGKSEQVVTTGKNKLQITTFNDGTKSKTLNGVTANINENGTISLSGTASAETQFYLTKNDFSLESGNGYFWCNSPSVNCRFEFVASIDGEEKYLNSYSTTPNTFNITSSFVYSGSTIKITSGTTTNVTLTPMVANGTFTEYEPYTGGQPSPSSDYKQPINSIEGSVEFACRGKNLFDVNNTMGVLVDTSIDEEGWITVNIDNSEGAATKYVNIWTHPNYNILPNKSYKLVLEIKSHSGSEGHLAAISDQPILSSQFNNQYLYYFKDMVDNSITIYDIVSKESFDESKTMIRTFIGSPIGSIQKLIFRISVVDDDKVTPQNFKYEPYIEPNEVTFNLNEEKLRLVGDVKDELVVDLDTGDYYKVENVGEYVFDGSDDENWKLDAITAGTEIRQFSNLIGNVLDKNDKIVRVISNYFRGVRWHLSWEKTNTITTYTYRNSSGFRLQSDKFENVEQLRQWLSTHNTIVDYVLKTPTTKKLGTLSTEDLAKLKTFKGYNNVTVNTNLGLMNIRFTYGLDIKKYIDNKLAEISAQLIKGE